MRSRSALRRRLEATCFDVLSESSARAGIGDFQYLYLLLVEILCLSMMSGRWDAALRGIESSGQARVGGHIPPSIGAPQSKDCASLRPPGDRMTPHIGMIFKSSCLVRSPLTRTPAVGSLVLSRDVRHFQGGTGQKAGQVSERHPHVVRFGEPQTRLYKPATATWFAAHMGGCWGHRSASPSPPSRVELIGCRLKGTDPRGSRLAGLFFFRHADVRSCCGWRYE